jgi:hypothetical protein
MQLIVVRRDLVGFQLLRATMRADGIWTTEITLATAGVWRAFAEFATDCGAATLGDDLFRRWPVLSHRPAGARQHRRHRGYGRRCCGVAASRLGIGTCSMAWPPCPAVMSGDVNRQPPPATVQWRRFFDP